jgi:hypothetical protein
VAEDHGAPGAEIVDVTVAIGICEVCSGGELEEWRSPTYRTKSSNWGVDASREESFGALMENLGAGTGVRLGSHVRFSIEGLERIGGAAALRAG